MSDLLYQGSPSLWRTHPFGSLLAILALLLGAWIGLTGQVPYLSAWLAAQAITIPFDQRQLGYALTLIAVLVLIGWWFATLVDRLEIRRHEIIWTHGLLARQYTEINMASVRTMRINQSLLQRLLNAGDLVIFTAGDEPELAVRGLPRPREVREHIKRQSRGGD
ncbi:MAG: PH domain-containing protein [Chromatiaceae bacterium]|nr:MAG: PH domain-containing protein [Chromatiaceae bacterium]